MTGGEALCSTLEQLGVKHVFGLPGTQNLALFDALRRSTIRTIVPTHELAAGFMANGYYRASGKPGVLTTIAGPGFAFTVAAIAEAAHDSAALIYIAGKPANRGRRFDLQEIDQRAILAPLVKRIIDVERTTDMHSCIGEAYATATAGEPGPVLVHVTDGVYASRAQEVADRVPPSERPAPDLALIEQTMGLLRRSRRVVLFAGQGASDAAGRLRQFAELLEAPVIATRSARGVLSEDHPLAMVSDPSKRAVRVLNALLDRSDLVLAIGCKFTHNGTYGFKLHLPPEKLVHIDASPAVLNANYPAQVVGCADATAFLDALCSRRNALKSRQPDWSAGELAQYKKAAARNPGLAEVKMRGVDQPAPEGFFTALRNAMPANSCLVTDSGLHQALATRYFRLREPRGLVIPSDFQSMGFGLPAAIGAKLAAPERTVVALLGDGGFLMSGMELLTAVRERIPLTVIVFKDGALGQIRGQQLSSFGHAHATGVITPDLALFARSIGADHILLGGGVRNAMHAALNSNAVTLVEVRMSDSVAIRLRQVKGLAREVVRKTLQVNHHI